MSLVLKQRQRGQFVIETEFSETLFLTETPVAFRRKDLSNRAFVGQRILTGIEERLLNNWLNGQDVDIVSLKSVQSSVISASGTPLPNMAPKVSVADSININLVGGQAFAYKVTLDDQTISDETENPSQLNKLWEVISAPGGADVTIVGSASQLPTITFDVTGTYRIRLTVTENDEGLSSSGTIRFEVR